MSLAIGVDIGGTKVAAGVVDEDGRVLATERRATPGADIAETEQVIVDVVADPAARYEGSAGGVGAAGGTASDRAPVLSSPPLACRDEPLLAALTDRIALPVLLDNDANG